MTVQELIDELSDMPKDLFVIGSYGESIDEVKIVNQDEMDLVKLD